jgi:hypothetical protein
MSNNLLIWKNFKRTFFFFFFVWDQGLSAGLLTCKADALLTEPHIQSTLLGLFLEMGVSGTSCLGWPQMIILPILDKATSTGTSD